MIEKLVKEKQQEREVKYLRMDNASKNKLLEQYINKVDNGLDITVEYTARNTFQQNSPVEQAFLIIYSKAKVSFSKANVPMEVRYKVFSYWIKTVLKLENLCIVKYNYKRLSRYKHMGLDLPK